MRVGAGVGVGVTVGSKPAVGVAVAVGCGVGGVRLAVSVGVAVGWGGTTVIVTAGVDDGIGVGVAVPAGVGVVVGVTAVTTADIASALFLPVADESGGRVAAGSISAVSPGVAVFSGCCVAVGAAGGAALPDCRASPSGGPPQDVIDKSKAEATNSESRSMVVEGATFSLYGRNWQPSDRGTANRLPFYA